MAKQWQPTGKQLRTYDEILKKYNKMRNQIVKSHRALEEHIGAGRMPALVVPERHRKMTISQIRISGRRLFALKIKQLKRVVHGGLQKFYSDYKKSYLELYREYIIQEDPEGYQGRFFSDLQIKEEKDPQMRQFMHDYNSIVNMNGTVFALLVKTGRVPEFRRLYDQFQGGFRPYENYGQQLHRAVRMSRYISVKDAEAILKEAKWSRWSKVKQTLYKKSFELEQSLREED